MQTTLVFVLVVLGLVSSLVTCDKVEVAEKRFVLSDCIDKIVNCIQYLVAAICNDLKYLQWAIENCAKTCNLCDNTTSDGGPLDAGRNIRLSPIQKGCVYNSQVYQQGQTWKDACKYKCECVDGTSGKYQCRQLCLAWNIPNSCRMGPPAPGKCCPKPVCPPSINLQYPPDYVEE